LRHADQPDAQNSKTCLGFNKPMPQSQEESPQVWRPIGAISFFNLLLPPGYKTVTLTELT
jgi:hypothetical protein